MPEPAVYITTPIYYVNDQPHLGHSYTTIMCDILRRYYGLLGCETYMLTGTDEHGQNILRVAEKSGRDVQKMVDENSATFRNLWPRLNIRNDDFIRTTEERHKKVVRKILRKTFESGDLYKAEYGGNYCVKCERFFTDTETESNPNHCPIHETELEYIRETNYFFRLGKYQGWLRRKIESDADFLQPAQFRNEVLALLREPLEDLCISRPKERLHWGIPLPFDDDFVTYVWYDALINYLSGIGYPDSDLYRKFWPGATHMIAKDILRQHAIYWPCMLHAAGIPPFKRLRVHGWWTVEGKKMSKSLGNVVKPLDEVEKYGLDVFRYILARDMTFGSDGNYSARMLVEHSNAELANNLGNLLSRLTSMIQKYCDGKMPMVAAPVAEDQALLAEVDALEAALPPHLDQCTIHQFLEKVVHAVTSANRYITDTAPWTLAKQGQTERLGTVLAVASTALAGCGRMLAPVMPDKMQQLLACFDIHDPRPAVKIEPGTAISQAPALFPRIEEPSIDNNPPTLPESAAPVGAAPLKPEISFEDFAKVDLRIATILEAERVPKTDKLMRLKVDLGVEQRQIVAGIAEHYTPEILVGRQIVVVANLAPRKLKGLVSQGMLLAGKSEDMLLLLRPDDELPAGSDVS